MIMMKITYILTYERLGLWYQKLCVRVHAIQRIGACLIGKCRHFLQRCPSYLIKNWSREVSRSLETAVCRF